MNTSTALPAVPGVLSVIHDSVQRALDAQAIANENLTALPVIFANAEDEGVSNRDRAYWGVNETDVRRWRNVSLFVDKDNDEGVDLLDIVRVLNVAHKTKGVGTPEIKWVAENTETVAEALDAIRRLIAEATTPTEAVADADAETESETDAPETDAPADQVLRWLKAVAGPLGKVRESVVAGHVLTESETEAFESVLSLVSGIASQRAFVPAPVAVSV